MVIFGEAIGRKLCFEFSDEFVFLINCNCRFGGGCGKDDSGKVSVVQRGEDPIFTTNALVFFEKNR